MKLASHELKILPEYFKAVVAGTKKFEIRNNDRDYHEGDLVVLREWGPDFGYTGYVITKKIGFITNYAQTDDYVVFSLLDPSEGDYLVAE
jgi:hypothetical protein